MGLSFLTEALFLNEVNSSAKCFACISFTISFSALWIVATSTQTGVRGDDSLFLNLSCSFMHAATPFFALCQLENLWMRCSRSKCSLTSTLRQADFLTSGSSEDISRLTSLDDISLSLFQRKSGLFHHLLSFIRSFARRPREASSAGLPADVTYLHCDGVQILCYLCIMFYKIICCTMANEYRVVIP